MKMPTIDQTRGIVQILASLVLLGAFVYMLVSGGDEDLLLRLLTLIISMTTGVNGVGLALKGKANGNGNDHHT
jgi:hypothetical protein